MPLFDLHRLSSPPSRLAGTQLANLPSAAPSPGNAAAPLRACTRSQSRPAAAPALTTGPTCSFARPGVQQKAWPRLTAPAFQRVADLFRVSAGGRGGGGERRHTTLDEEVRLAGGEAEEGPRAEAGEKFGQRASWRAGGRLAGGRATADHFT